MKVECSSAKFRGSVLFLAAFAVFSSFLASCTSPIKEPYRVWVENETNNAVKHRVIRNGNAWLQTNPLQTNDYTFSVIEFDDMGQLLDRDQLTETYRTIEQLKAKQPILLLMYVHGWKHSATETDKNLVSFYQFVTNAARAKLRNYSNNTYAVVGVYLGWRGNIFDFGKNNLQRARPVSTTLAYYNRDAAAKRVAGASATEVILSLAGLAKARSLEVLNEIRDSPDKMLNGGDWPKIPADPLESRVVIAGHSMGGLIVESAVAQAIIGHMAIRAPQHHVAELFRATNSTGGNVITNYYLSRTNLGKASNAWQNATKVYEEAVAEARRQNMLVEDWKRCLRDWETRKENLQEGFRGALKEWQNVVQAQIKLAQKIDLAAGLLKAPMEPDYSDPEKVLNAMKEFPIAGVSNVLSAVEMWMLAHQWRTTGDSLSALIDKSSDELLGKAKNLMTAGRNRSRDYPVGLALLQNDSPYKDITTLDNANKGLRYAEKLVIEIADKFRTSAMAARDRATNLMPKLANAKLPQDVDLKGELKELKGALANAETKISKISVEESKTALNALNNAQGAVRKAVPQCSDTPEHAAECVGQRPKDLLKSKDDAFAAYGKALDEYHRRAGEVRTLASAAFVDEVMSQVVPADLIVLINPASSALIAQKFTDALNNTNVNQRVEQDWRLPGYRPLVINLSSPGDRATRTIFWMAHGLGGLAKTFTPDSLQGRNYRNTAAHLWDFATHRIERDSVASSNWLSASNVWNGRVLVNQNLKPNGTNNNEFFLRMNLLPTNGWINEDGITNLLFATQIVSPKGVYSLNEARGTARSEYWVVDCDSDLLPGHNEFWTPEFYATLGSLVRVRQLYNFDPSRFPTNNASKRPMTSLEEASARVRLRELIDVGQSNPAPVATIGNTPKSDQ